MHPDIAVTALLSLGRRHSSGRPVRAPILLHLDIQTDIGLLVLRERLKHAESAFKIDSLALGKSHYGSENRDIDSPDLRQDVTSLQFDDSDAMRIILIETYRYGRATVTGTSTHRLRKMNVTEGKIIETVSEFTDVDAVKSSYDYILLARIASYNGGMRHQHYRQVFLIDFSSPFKKGSEEGCRPLMTGHILGHGRKVLRITMRHSCYIPPDGLADRNYMPVQIVRRISACNGTDCMDGKMFPQASVSLYSRSAVMIAGRHDYGHAGGCFMDTQHILYIHLSGRN